jgi:hypothetical protein
MSFIQKIKKRSILGNTMIVLVATALGAAAVTDALAAGRSGGGGFRGGFRGGYIGRGGPLLNSVPSAPAPIFNPSSPYTVSPSPETPVSPASPGSIFGNG